MRRRWTVLIVAFGAGAALALVVALAAGRLVPAPAPPSELPPPATAALAEAGIELGVARPPAHCVVDDVAIDRGWLSRPALGCPVTARTARGEAFRQTDLGRAGPTSLALASWSDEPASVRDRLVWLVVVKGECARTTSGPAMATRTEQGAVRRCRPRSTASTWWMRGRAAS